MSRPLNEDFEYAYIAVSEGFSVGLEMDWDEFCLGYLGIEPVDEDDKEARSYHVQRRLAFVRAVNERAATNGDSWRLFVRNGQGVFKEEMDAMVSREAERKMRKVGNSFSNAADALQPMLEVPNLKRPTRALIQNISAIGEGARMMIAGAVSASVLPGYYKNMLIEAMGLPDLIGRENENDGAT